MTASRTDQLLDEIKWNERRLANLVLSWEDQQQTMDLLCDLRAELHQRTTCNDTQRALHKTYHELAAMEPAAEQDAHAA
jgi:hypothetical protein